MNPFVSGVVLALVAVVVILGCVCGILWFITLPESPARTFHAPSSCKDPKHCYQYICRNQCTCPDHAEDEKPLIFGKHAETPMSLEDVKRLKEHCRPYIRGIREQ